MGTTFNHSSWEEFLVQATEANQHVDLCAKGRISRRDSKESDHQSGFYGTDTWAEALDLLENGWAEGREFMDQILTEVAVNESAVPKKKVLWDVEGDCVDIGRFVSGEPECMMRWSKRPSKVRRVRMLVNMSVSAGVSTETMKWKGACLLALVDRLESAGIRCEIDLGFSLGSGENWTETVTVKAVNEPLQIDRLAFIMAHPAGYRRIFFSYQEASRLRQPNGKLCADEHRCSIQGGWYGIPRTEMAQYLPEDVEPYDLIVPGMQLYGVTQAIAQMEKLFNQVCATKTNYSEV